MITASDFQSSSRVQLSAESLSSSNSGQVVHSSDPITHVSLSPSSIICYHPKGGDALRLEK